MHRPMQNLNQSMNKQQSRYQLDPQHTILAIDYGTSNSLVCAADKNTITSALPLDPYSAKDASIVRSILFSPAANQFSFGSKAIEDYLEYGAEGRLLRSLKRFLPRESFKGTVIHDLHFDLSELIAVFLRELRVRAMAHLHLSQLDRLVLGRPALYAEDAAADALAEQRMKEAALLAGFKEVRFCPEPVAAAYDFHQSTAQETVSLIADFGGGTSDFSIVKLGGSDSFFSSEKVLGIGGISIAGDAFDSVLMKHEIAPFFGSNVHFRLPMGQNLLTIPRHLLDKLSIPAEISLLGKNDIKELLLKAKRWAIESSSEDARRMNRLFTLIEENLGYRLFQQIEKCKIELCNEQASANFVFDYPDIEISEDLFYNDFAHHAAPLCQEIVSALDRTLKRLAIDPARIEKICFTGGTAQIPFLQAEFLRRFPELSLSLTSTTTANVFHSIINGLGLRAREWSLELI